jgi:retinol dehydrogenase-14
MASLSEQTVLVTGANTGMGLVTAQALAAQGATVLLGCRDAKKAEEARAAIVAKTGNDKVSVLQLDLASTASIDAAASQIKKLDVLVNNAGAWWQDRRLSKDGLELQWATNVVGPQRLTLKLLPLLEASGHGRIVNVASTAAGGLDLSDPEYKNRPYNGVNAYSAAKQANRMLTWALARRLKGKPVVVNALSPGLVRTELNRSAKGFFGFVFSILKYFARTPEKGADTAIWLASSEEASKLNDQFFVDRKATDCKFRNQADEEKLWALTSA